MDTPVNRRGNSGHGNSRGNRNISLSGLEEKLNVPNFFNPEMTNVSMGNFEVFNRNAESILKSSLFGIPVYVIAIIGAVLWLVKK